MTCPRSRSVGEDFPPGGQFGQFGIGDGRTCGWLVVFVSETGATAER